MVAETEHVSELMHKSADTFQIRPDLVFKTFSDFVAAGVVIHLHTAHIGISVVVFTIHHPAMRPYSVVRPAVGFSRTGIKNIDVVYISVVVIVVGRQINVGRRHAARLYYHLRHIGVVARCIVLAIIAVFVRQRVGAEHIKHRRIFSIR